MCQQHFRCSLSPSLVSHFLVSYSKCSNPFWYFHHSRFCFSYLRSWSTWVLFFHEIHISKLACFWKTREHLRGVRNCLPIFTPNWESDLVQMGPPDHCWIFEVACSSWAQDPLNPGKYRNEQRNKPPRASFVILSFRNNRFLSYQKLGQSIFCFSWDA